MKKVLTLVLLVVLLASAAFAAKPPSPKYLKIATVANDDTVYLAVRGKQSNGFYTTKYVTLLASAALSVQFDPAAEVIGYYTVTESGRWQGTSYDYYLGNKILCPAATKVIVKVSAKDLLITDVGGAPGSLEIWAEYED